MIRMIHNPLLNRFKIIRIIPSTIDEWAEFMQDRYGDAWDKRTYSFLRRFADEDYLLRVPKTPEGLENYPTPRSWTFLALDLKEGFYSLEDITGLVGEEVGRKFDGFLKTSVDLDDLLKKPQLFHGLNFDAKYMVPIMLASWFTQNLKKVKDGFPLLDSMSDEKHEFVVMSCISMARKNLVALLRDLFYYKASYREVLEDIALKIKDEIAV